MTWTPRWWREPALWLWLREKDATAAKERRWQDAYDGLEKHLEDYAADVERLEGELGFALDANYDLRAECVILRQRIALLEDRCPSDLSELDQ